MTDCEHFLAFSVLIRHFHCKKGSTTTSRMPQFSTKKTTAKMLHTGTSRAWSGDAIGSRSTASWEP